MSTTVRTNTEKPSTATMPLIAWYGPSSRTMCHTTAVNTPEVDDAARPRSSTDASNTRGDVPHERAQQHDHERGAERGDSSGAIDEPVDRRDGERRASARC